MISKAQVTAHAAGDGLVGEGANLLSGPPGGSHLAAIEQRVGVGVD